MFVPQTISCFHKYLVASLLLYLTLIEKSPSERSNSLEDDKYSNIQANGMSGFVSASDTQNGDSKDYYEILGVSKDAKKQEIHKAFRRLAKKYHPDVNKDKNAEEDFIRIFKAYETLSDEKKRSEYDNRSKGNTYTQWNSAHGDNFDMNEFYKRYEEQLFNHAQFFQQQNIHQHQYHHHSEKGQFSFNGVNLGDLFHDLDEDEFNIFGDILNSHHMNNHHNNHFDHHNQAHNINPHHQDADGTFGDGASYFNNFIPNHHNAIHSHQTFSARSHNGNGYSCQTIQKQVNGMIMTQTSCT